MGHANIWIRKENEDQWEALENKAEFVNNALQTNKPSKLSTKRTPKRPAGVINLGEELRSGRECRHGRSYATCLTHVCREEFAKMVE